MIYWLLIVLISVFAVFYVKHRQKVASKVEELKKQLNDLKTVFNNTLTNFFNSGYNYQITYSELSNTLSKIEEKNRIISKLSRKSAENELVEDLKNKLAKFKRMADTVEFFPKSKMIDEKNYGKINKSYWDSVKDLNRFSVDNFISECEQSFNFNMTNKICETDIDMLLKCVWFYATDKPYSANSFKKASELFYKFYKKVHIDTSIAELYAMKQMGGENVLHDRVKSLQNNQENVALIASALMWMNAYQVEHTLLQFMLTSGLQMSSKMQERLHSLSNGGGNAPVSFDVSSGGGDLYFDVSALTWKEEQYVSLFEDLSFKDNVLSYSLAVRDENKELNINNGVSLPALSDILVKLSAVFYNEYANSASTEIRNCVALSGSGEERLEGILMTSNECNQMRILMHLARIGKKLNIKFYTLFMPSGRNLSEQKQQALSLHNKLSPTVAMWENSLKDTALTVLQQILNSAPQQNVNVHTDNSTVENDEIPIF